MGRKKHVRLEFPSLNSQHDAFLLVDDGTSGSFLIQFYSTHQQLTKLKLSQAEEERKLRCE